MQDWISLESQNQSFYSDPLSPPSIVLIFANGVVEYILWCTWTHRQWCYLGSSGVSGLPTIRHPRPGTQPGLIKPCVQVALLHPQISAPNPPWGHFGWLCGRLDSLSCFPKLTFSSQSCAVASRPEEVVLAAGVSLSHGPDKSNGPLCWAEVLAVADPIADDIYYGLQDLVMVPAGEKSSP